MLPTLPPPPDLPIGLPASWRGPRDERSRRETPAWPAMLYRSEAFAEDLFETPSYEARPALRRRTCDAAR